MLTKQPDYTISELGYPLLCEDRFYKKCRPQATTCSHSSSHSHSPLHSHSPSRLLPLRETLDDYNKRLLSEQSEKLENCVAGRRRDLDDMVAQQKRQKNLWNEQQQQRDSNSNNNNNNRGNHKCRDRTQAAQSTTRKATLVTCDLNSF